MSIGAILKEINANGERYLLLPLYALIVVTVLLEVFRRFVISYSSIWGEEIARYAFIYVSWIAASICVKDRTHIKLDIVIHFVSDRWKAFLFFIGDILMLVMAIIALYWSMEPLLVSMEFGSVTDGLRISRVWFLAAVPLGFGMMIIRVIQTTIEDWRSFYLNEPLKKAKKMFD